MSTVFIDISNNLPKFASKAKEFGAPSTIKIPANYA